MMKKIPVIATIAHAYRFVFQDFLAIIRVMWVTWALLLAVMLLARGPMTAFNLAMASHDFSLMQGQWTWITVFYLATFVAMFIQMTGLTQLALGQKTGSPYFYFSLAKPVWRLIGATLLVMLALIAVAIAYALVAAALGWLLRMALTAYASQIMGRAVTGILILIAVAIAYGGFIYCAVRFFFLLAPVTLAEERIGLNRAWTLTKANFWRCFLIMLSILVPFCAIEIAGLLALAGPLPLLPHGNSAVALAALREAQRGWQFSSATRMQHYWYLTYPLAGILGAIFYGLSCAAQAFAYRALTDGEASAPVAGD
jgi:hypothetical protein